MPVPYLHSFSSCRVGLSSLPAAHIPCGHSSAADCITLHWCCPDLQHSIPMLLWTHTYVFCTDVHAGAAYLRMHLCSICPPGIAVVMAKSMQAMDRNHTACSLSLSLVASLQGDVTPVTGVRGYQKESCNCCPGLHCHIQCCLEIIGLSVQLTMLDSLVEQLAGFTQCPLLCRHCLACQCQDVT